MNRKIVLTLILLVMVFGGGTLGLGPRSYPVLPRFHYESQSFECYLEENGSKVRIMHVAVISCSFGYLDTIKLTIPYGDREILVAEEDVEVSTAAGESLDREIHQTGNETTILIYLPRWLGGNRSIAVVILRYWIHDLPGDSGISRPLSTGFLEGLLGGGERFQVTYRPGVFDDRLDNLVVSMFAPIGDVPKTFEAISDGYPPPEGPYRESWTGRLGLLWRLTTYINDNWKDIPKAPEFRAVFGKPSLLESHPGLVILGVMSPFIVCGLILVLRKVKYHSSTKLIQDGEK